MNSTPPFSKAAWIATKVLRRGSVTFRSTLLTTARERLADLASCSCVHPSRARAARIWLAEIIAATFLTPDLVIEAARSKDSPLHGCFTWDVKRAALEHWREQARSLIRSVKVEITTTHISLRAPAFVRDPSAAGDTQSYTSLGRLQTDEEMARDAVVAEFSRAATALARAKTLALALGLENEIEDVRGRVVQLSERASQAAA